ncbi:MAG: SulP family inorganic anion transporter [Flavobacteriales bacterium]|nr:MAG: SulP family inorganic anion transporter [Flavobacteriales bacterium]
MKSNFFKHWQEDLPASIVVFFVAVPLCLGIALASGAPLFSGLIAGIIGGIVVGAISDSSLGVSGPAAGLAIIVLHAIQDLGAFEIFLVAVVIGGVIQVVLGILRGGVIGFYFPSAVIKGMLAAIGIIIFVKQIPHAFGYDKDYEGDMAFQQSDGQNTFSELTNMLDFVTPSSILVATVSLFILLLWDLVLTNRSKVFKIIPGPLVAVIFGIVYQLISTKYFPSMNIKSEHLVSVPTSANLNQFFNNFTSPDFSAIGNMNVWLTGVTIAVVASLETLLCVDATDKLDPEKRTTNTNRELLAQGSGNIISGLIGGLPITQVIVRSSANIQSGGKTKMSAIIHGVFILVCVSLIPVVLNLIPLAVLASILFVVGYKLAKPTLFKSMYQAGWKQFVPFLATVLGVVFIDLLKGISLGMLVAIITIIPSKLSDVFTINEETQNGVRKIKMILSEKLTFFNKRSVFKALEEIEGGAEVTIDMSNSKYIDSDIVEIIDDFNNQAKERNISVSLLK